MNGNNQAVQKKNGEISFPEKENNTDPASIEGSQRRMLSDAAKGTILCLLSDIIFSFSYFFVRWLTTYGSDMIHRDWTFCFKEAITTAGTLPIFLYCWMKGKCAPPPLRITCLIILAAFFCEFVGVRAHIFAFEKIGMMLGNPLIRTFTILGTAFIGMIFLKEKIGWLKSITIIILICAVFTLAFSQSTGGGQKFELTDTFMLGLGMALVTGCGYALYTILLRFVLRKAKADGTATGQESKPIPISFIVSVVCGFGAVVGGICLYMDRGWEGFISYPGKEGSWIGIPGACWLFVGLAGGLNVICFFLKNLALRYATASKVAVFSVVQILLATILGILFFKENFNATVFIGLAMIVLGIVLASKTK
ncbi:MAG: DMT family transporter [Planctomycetia bacterium]|nr:DMT family transporter [Planctomycetia bacterium]